MKLKNKVAIITGAGQGIGKAIALEFAQNGAKLVLLDINLKNLKELANQVKHLNTEVLAIKCDVTKENQIVNAVKKVIKKHKQIDILVNNAGIFTQKPLINVNTKDWDKQINTNLRGTFLTIKNVAKYMIKQKKGKIISLSSIAGKVGLTNSSVYSAANGGIINLTKQMAGELSPHNININTVSPGIIITKMTEKLLNDKNIKRDLLSNIPMNRFGTAEEVADAVLFLASNDANFITGHNLVVDGGWLTH
jgi:3-oxoacyl-[acyl-carrier protein] reductase